MIRHVTQVKARPVIRHRLCYGVDSLMARYKLSQVVRVQDRIKTAYHEPISAPLRFTMIGNFNG